MAANTSAKDTLGKALTMHSGLRQNDGGKPEVEICTLVRTLAFSSWPWLNKQEGPGYARSFCNGITVSESASCQAVVDRR